MVKNPPANEGDARDMGSIPESGRFPGKEMATHSSILAWRSPWTERSLAGYSPWGRKESDVTEHAMPGSRMICGLLVMACGI